VKKSDSLYLKEKSLSPILKTRRLSLKIGKIGMASGLWQAIKKDRELGRQVWGKVHSLQEAKDYIRETSQKNPGPEMIYYLLSQKDELIGSFHLHTFSYFDHKVELGYWIVKSFEGQGFMSEALLAVENELVRLKFHRSEIRCNPLNSRSVKFALRNQYSHEGTLREDTRVEGGFIDTAVYGKILTTHL
jgi:RimJ/RimL family protein N-acetyltransferase